MIRRLAGIAVLVTAVPIGYSINGVLCLVLLVIAVCAVVETVGFMENGGRS